jgi:hypothetical protein
MNQPPPTGKRIVTRRQYVESKARKTVFGVGIAGGCIFGSAGLLLTLLSLFYAIVLVVSAFTALLHSEHVSVNEWLAVIFSVGVCALFGTGTYLLGMVVEKSVERSAKEEDVVPLTRANADQIPATQSLIRASHEPMQEQQAVLLRPALHDALTSPAQLVRPASKQE